MTISSNIRGFQPRTADPGSVSPDLLSEVRKELGEATLGGIDDDKVDTLKGYFVDGLEYPDFQPVKVLGEGWKDDETDFDPSTHEFILQYDLNQDSQRLVIDSANSIIHLTTVNSEPGPFENTLDNEGISWRISDDQVKRQRSKAV